ncbi:MAG TPA: hypothetical protein VJV79_21845 [Polyangiaceae bacterium]|nr:hypothetical protein [Polyangiaceae bacterium]
MFNLTLLLATRVPKLNILCINARHQGVTRRDHNARHAQNRIAMLPNGQSKLPLDLIHVLAIRAK